eukprot:IDg18131t1
MRSAEATCSGASAVALQCERKVSASAMSSRVKYSVSMASSRAAVGGSGYAPSTPCAIVCILSSVMVSTSSGIVAAMDDVYRVAYDQSALIPAPALVCGVVDNAGSTSTTFALCE